MSGTSWLFIAPQLASCPRRDLFRVFSRCQLLKSGGMKPASAQAPMFEWYQNAYSYQMCVALLLGRGPVDEGAYACIVIVDEVAVLQLVAESVCDSH